MDAESEDDLSLYDRCNNAIVHAGYYDVVNAILDGRRMVYSEVERSLLKSYGFKNERI